MRVRPLVRSTLRLNSVTFQTGSSPSGIRFCPTLGAGPSPSMISVFTAWMRSLPPSAAAASLTTCISGGTCAHAPESAATPAIHSHVFMFDLLFECSTV